MHRSAFAPPPAQSPPLHHPIPQHVSTVPMMRSPPPPASQQQPQTTNTYGNPYQPQPGQGNGPSFGQDFGGFISDPTAQMGFQIGKSAAATGQEYVKSNVSYLSLAISEQVDGDIPWDSYTDSFVTAQPLRVHSSSEALLQRLQHLCAVKAPPRAVPLASQAMVAPASPSQHLNHLGQRANGSGAIYFCLPPSTR